MKTLSDADVARVADAVIARLRASAGDVIRSIRGPTTIEAFMASPLAEKAAAVRDAIEAEAGLSPGAVTGACRAEFILPARFAAILCIHDEMPEISLPQLGAIMGGRDHSTIMHALKRAKTMHAAGEIGWLLSAGRKALRDMEG